jgi:hypothetical protein
MLPNCCKLTGLLLSVVRGCVYIYCHFNLHPGRGWPCSVVNRSVHAAASEHDLVCSVPNNISLLPSINASTRQHDGGSFHGSVLSDTDSDFAVYFLVIQKQEQKERGESDEQ